MKVAITGGTGFVGRHLARALAGEGHEVVIIARGHDRRDDSIRSLPNVRWVPAGVGQPEALLRAFDGCDAVAHCAGINRQIGSQTYARVHIQGTANVVEAAVRAGVKNVVMLSFITARPDCGSGYHESKWEAEEIIRRSGLDYTIVKAGMIYGRGDHMLDHLSHSMHTVPFLPTVGFRERRARPLAVADLVRILQAALVEGRLRRQTVAALGPEELTLAAAARRVARVAGIRLLVLPAPVAFQYLVAWLAERLMTVPLVAIAQVRILSENLVPIAPVDALPADLAPRTFFTDEVIREGLPAPGPFGVSDLRYCAGRLQATA
ncbi:MAG: NAD(P)H-binding protein [Candidatus Dormibacteraeota bacterium]|nr:NAD(P)H-binding protein [Candidatus Dormibacteraeota bacterium]